MPGRGDGGDARDGGFGRRRDDDDGRGAVVVGRFGREVDGGLGRFRGVLEGGVVVGRPGRLGSLCGCHDGGLGGARGGVERRGRGQRLGGRVRGRLVGCDCAWAVCGLVSTGDARRGRGGVLVMVRVVAVVAV